ncbi:nuclear transport factor 2 family protein [Nafulsella turpanensis]|uniref:nuclear transport factor 2 family protein n=1 Tax=Nafulsella turpanensis TaxID=1265690 RepID=UPI00135F1444|nr:nuclear transport factor 2 family protein [Nafulsella turpanensis]
MKTPYSLLIALVLLLFSQGRGLAQQLSDEAQIRETVTNYIEGRNGGDLERLRKAFHPGAALKFVDPGSKALGEWSLEEYLQRLTPGEKLNCRGEIIDIRRFEDAAQATVLLTYPNLRFHDYMSLLKINGQWLIVDKTFARSPSAGRVLIAITSHADLGDTGRKAGLNLKEVAYVYKALDEAGYAVDFVSPKGKFTHLYGQDLNDPVIAWFVENEEAWSRLQQTLLPVQVNPDDYQAIYFAGGHGTMWDFPENSALANLAASIYEKEGIVAAICHGSVGLVNIRLSNGTPLVKGKKLTGFTNAEETEIGLAEEMPFLLQTALEEKGGEFTVAPNWSSHIELDQRLLTGQNAQSVEALAKELVAALQQPDGSASKR